MNTQMVTCPMTNAQHPTGTKATNFMHCHTHEEVWVHNQGDPFPQACPRGTDDCKIHFGYAPAWDRG